MLTSRGVAATPIASFEGNLTIPKQIDEFEFLVDSSVFKLNEKGKVDLIFVTSPDGNSSLDPNAAVIKPRKVIKPNPLFPWANAATPSTKRKANHLGSRSSLTLATLSKGTFKVWVSGEKKSIGSYRLDVFLAGDANGDFTVDGADWDLIKSLLKRKKGETGYTLAADANRDGVIDKWDLKRCGLNSGATALNVGGELPHEQIFAPGALALVDAPLDRFYDITRPLEFSIAGTTFDTAHPEDTLLSINGTVVPLSALVITDEKITATGVLQDGANEITLKTYDVNDAPLYFDATLWAGSAKLTVSLVDGSAAPFIGASSVRLLLSDDETVGETKNTTTGSVEFLNVPARTVIVRATGPANEMGSAGLVGATGTTVIVMEGFKGADPTANNDFSQGLAGWDVGSSPVQIIPHVENIPGLEEASAPSSNAAAAIELANQDLSLNTSGEGPRSLSRTFASTPGSTAVIVRYRFITSEIPGGFFGSEYNDYFRVSLRSLTGGGQKTEVNSMNGLGLAAFSPSGSTDWREVTLPLDVDGDIVQVDVVVANVGDGEYDSSVVVDFVEEVRDEIIPALTWNNTAGGLDIRYQVKDAPTTQAATVNLSWASGPSYEQRIGAPIHTIQVPAGTGPGSYGSFNVGGSKLHSDPAGCTHLIAWSGPSKVAQVKDVKLNYGPNANAAVVVAAMRDFQKDAFRVAGNPSAWISRTAVTPEDQARAMFNNLTNPANTLAVNIANQNKTYYPPGQSVVKVFADAIVGLTRDQVIADAATIKASMLDKINEVGPDKVSKHCADPTEFCVADVGEKNFNSSNMDLYVNSISGRVYFLDERNTNHCFHSQIKLAP